MNYLDRADAKFVALAIDDSQRRTAIEQLSTSRRLTMWSAGLSSFGFVTVFILGAVHPTFGAVGGAIGGFATGIQWVNLMKFESELRLLKVVEQLRR